MNTKIHEDNFNKSGCCRMTLVIAHGDTEANLKKVAREEQLNLALISDWQVFL